MIPLEKKTCIQIEITSHCNLTCKDCSRFCGHQPNVYFLPLTHIKAALKSLEGFKGTIGCIGGEPTLHPKFEEICKLYQEYVPFEQRGLWTNGARWKENEKLIRETFPIKNIVYNAHDFEYKGYHQPLLIAMDEIIKDLELRDELIDKCWVQKRWSACMNPNGAFFCEVAGAMDMLMDLDGGWEVKKDWWKRKDVSDQIEIYCSKCSMCIPFDKSVYDNPKQLATVGNIELLYNNGVRDINRFDIYYKEYTRKDYEKNVNGWKPGIFRNFNQHEPNERIYK
jgi:hypothetical protein